MYLPDLILIELFSNFNFGELFNLRIVCKRWKLLIECLAKNQNRICVSPPYNYYNPKLKINNQRIKYDKVIDQPFFENFCLDKNYFINIKKLFLDHTNLINFNRKRIRSKMKYILVDLEELHILSLECRGVREMSDDDLFDKVLNFKNLKFLKLKILSIINIHFEKKLTLNCPILENLSFHSLFLNLHRPVGIPILENYDTIKTLECDNPNIFKRKLLNLEHLICRCIDSNFNLLNYPKLKRLDVFPTKEEIPIIENLYRQKNQYQNFKDLQILIFGLPISVFDNNAKKLCSVFILTREYIYAEGCLEPIKKNYLDFKTDHHPWNYYIKFEDSIFDTYQYFSKINVCLINAEELKDTKILINFIIKIGGVQALELYKCKIEKDAKEYFEKVPFIHRLWLSYCEIERNCDFICNIKELSEFFLDTNNHPFQNFIDTCINKNFVESKLLFRPFILIYAYCQSNEIRISMVNDKIFDETIKVGDYKMDDILPILLNKLK